MSIAPLTFTGVSSFSSDFQTILNRAVSIANLPLQQLQNQQSDILQEKTLAGNLSSAVADLATTIGKLASIGGSKALEASSSNSSVVAASASGATTPAYHTITNITSVARAASESSIKGYATTDKDAVSATGSMTLSFGGKNYSIKLDAGKNTLSGLQSAIAATGAPITASILTTGSGSTPDYLSVAANNTGATTLALYDNVAGVGYADADTTAVSSSDKLTLTVGNNSYSIDLTGKNNLNGLRDAINAVAGAGVTASVVNAGSGANPYKLVLTPAKEGTAVAVGASVLTSTNQGADTVFQFDGVDVTRSGAMVNDLISGLTFTVKDKTDTGEIIGITLASNRSQISSALNELVTKYNAVATQVNAQMGSGAGLLSGNSIIRDVRNAMSSLVQYSGTGSGQIKSLSDLGIALSSTGQMSFDSSKLNSLTDSQVQDAFGFLGSSTSGLGKLKSAFTQISDPLLGSIKSQISVFDAADKRLTEQISDLTERINLMQTSLQSKLQAADSLLASLNSQQNLLLSSIDSLNYTTYGRQEG